MPGAEERVAGGHGRILPAQAIAHVWAVQIPERRAAAAEQIGAEVGGVGGDVGLEVHVGHPKASDEGVLDSAPKRPRAGGLVPAGLGEGAVGEIAEGGGHAEAVGRGEVAGVPLQVAEPVRSLRAPAAVAVTAFPFCLAAVCKVVPLRAEGVVGWFDDPCLVVVGEPASLGGTRIKSP